MSKRIQSVLVIFFILTASIAFAQTQPTSELDTLRAENSKLKSELVDAGLREQALRNARQLAQNSPDGIAAKKLTLDQVLTQAMAQATATLSSMTQAIDAAKSRASLNYPNTPGGARYAAAVKEVDDATAALKDARDNQRPLDQPERRVVKADTQRNVAEQQKTRDIDNDQGVLIAKANRIAAQAQVDGLKALEQEFRDRAIISYNLNLIAVEQQQVVTGMSLDYANAAMQSAGKATASPGNGETTYRWEFADGGFVTATILNGTIATVTDNRIHH